MPRLKKTVVSADFRLIPILLAQTLTILISASFCSAQTVTLTPFNPTGIYKLGDKIGWTITLPDHSPAPSGKYSFTIKKNNFSTIQSGQLDLSSGKATIETSVDEPAMLYLKLTPPGAGPPTTRPVAAGAAVAPTQLQPVAPRPADFDHFWESKIKLLQSIPPNPVLTPVDSGNPNIEYDTIKMDQINGLHVQGQIAVPKRPGKFPALVVFQWASPPYRLQRSWVTNHAAEGWLTLNIEPHDVLPDQPKPYYVALPKAIKNYQTIGEDDRDKSYFLQMYLADYRAIDYIASRPDWDGKTLVVMGTSMGGQQSLCVTGLNPKVTHVIVDEPAGCDTNGPLHGRQSGYPNFPSNNPKIMQTALYFDTINFTSRIHVPTLVAMGFVDTTAPPAGVWTAFNQIHGPKEVAPMIDSPHNNFATDAQQRPYTSRAAEWLKTLVTGGSVQVGDAKTKAPEPSSSAAVPSPRTDTNSKLAHIQLLEKAKKGGIDVYFLGDSITRRWGCTDPAYADRFANWKENFFGWNAADFGWGADQIQNILWRIENGELDNVNPKIIVILAGTNNIGSQPADDAKIADITQGFQALIDVCQAKAPAATIVLTGIFPRNDNMAVIPTINKINDNLQMLANGTTIRYLNVNEKLADSNGKLFDGMMNAQDNLHPTVKGYQVWADGLKLIFTELLGQPAQTDHAPPAIGDPSITSTEIAPMNK